MEMGNSTVREAPEGDVAAPTTATGIQSPFGNGVLKIHAPLYHNHNPNHHPVVIRYRECLKNHAAALGGHAVDGCGEFMPSPEANPSDPTSLTCAACGCHRNFHRRENDDPHAPPAALPALEYQPNHRHHPPPPPPLQMVSSPNNSPSPPPISSSYFPSAPHMLMALSHGLDGTPPLSAAGSEGLLSRKRFRTKFTQNQKERMLEFAEKIEWRMQKSEADAINEFCRDIGVEKSVFKVWMHNNKHSFVKKDPALLLNSSSATTTPLSSATHGGAGDSNDNTHNHLDTGRSQTLGTNGSSSS